MTKEKKELNYKIVLFKLKDHTTWRMTTKSAFDAMEKVNVTGPQKIIVIDRLTGEVTIQ